MSGWRASGCRSVGGGVEVCGAYWVFSLFPESCAYVNVNDCMV